MQEAIERFINKASYIDEGDIQFMIQSFMVEHNSKFVELCGAAFGDANSVSLAAYRKIAQDTLREGIVTFVNKKYAIEKIQPYLLSCLKVATKRLSHTQKQLSYRCPGCNYLGELSLVTSYKSQLLCGLCESRSHSTTVTPSLVALSKTFAKYSKNGYRCEDCENFIPKPADDRSVVSCPYPDCVFTGKISEMSKMSPPRVLAFKEFTTLDSPFNKKLNSPFHNTTSKDALSDCEPKSTLSTTDSNLLVIQNTKENYEILMEVIDSQRKVLSFNSNESTLKHKTLMYDAFLKIIERHPNEMIAYLVHQTRTGGIQHKIFQEYANLLEAAMPYTYLKGGKPMVVNSLLDDKLCIFDGKSEFDAEVTKDHEIENNTKEFYIGGRKGVYCKPFYIGKLVSIVNGETGENLMPMVEQYSFFKIEMDKSVARKTPVTVQHLRIPPHYQMGGMVYLNRIRRKIVDRVYKILHGRDRRPSR